MSDLTKTPVVVLFPSYEGKGTEIVKDILVSLPNAKVVPVLYGLTRQELLQLRQSIMSQRVEPLVSETKNQNKALEMGYRFAILNFPDQPVVSLNVAASYRLAAEATLSLLEVSLKPMAMVIGSPSIDSSNENQRLVLALHTIISRGRVLCYDCSFQAFSSAAMCSTILNGLKGAMKIVEKAERLDAENKEIQWGLDTAMALAACIRGIPMVTTEINVIVSDIIFDKEKYECLLKIGVAANILWG